MNRREFRSVNLALPELPGAYMDTHVYTTPTAETLGLVWSLDGLHVVLLENPGMSRSKIWQFRVYDSEAAFDIVTQNFVGVYSLLEQSHLEWGPKQSLTGAVYEVLDG